MSNSKINVYFRIKPFNRLSENDNNIISYVCPNINIQNPKPRVFNKKYQSCYVSNNVLDESHNNNQIYKHTIKNDINNNKNILLIAYGQTGSGKTHTLVGKSDEIGLIPIVVKELLYKNLDSCCTVLEIYQDKIYDLLSSCRQELNIMEYNKNLHYKKNPITKYIRTENDIQECMLLIERNKTMGCTKINNTSSRAHTIYFFKSVKTNQEFVAIDLAGNERGSLSSAKNKEDNREYISINKSLFALKECIRANYLSKPYIPYRRSKLTMFLREILYRSPNIHFIGTLNPSAICYPDIIDTIEYGLCLRQSNIKKLITPVKNTPIYNNHLIPKYKPIYDDSNSSLKISNKLISSKSDTKLVKVKNNLIKTKLYVSKSTPTIKKYSNKPYVQAELMKKYFKFIIKHYSIAQKHQKLYKILAKYNEDEISIDKIPLSNIISIIEQLEKETGQFKDYISNLNQY
tara:strand:- start:12155 stop:13534 length:1380 start_codon:yes stop_codon:yes gene_type:complete